MLLRSAILIAILALASHAAYGREPIYRDLYNFSQPTGGTSGLVTGGRGVLYGTTTQGGPYAGCLGNNEGSCGTVFSLSPPATVGGDWTAATLWAFAGTPDGAYPSGVVLGDGGILYGTTAEGGSGTNSDCNGKGCGTVFALTPPATAGGAWTENILWDFGSVAGDGIFPQRLISGKNGALYGITERGGGSDYGTVFALIPSGGGWTESVIWSFGSSQQAGFYPRGLVMDRRGTLYVVTETGGQGEAGLLISLDPPEAAGGAWSETDLFSFKTYLQEGYPQALAIAGDGTLYVTTGGVIKRHGRGSGGAIFQFSKPMTTGGAWQHHEIFLIVGIHDGKSALGCRLQDPVLVAANGDIYESAPACGKYGNAHKLGGYGTVLQLTPPAGSKVKWTATVLHNFGVKGGTEPFGGLVQTRDGALYGSAQSGGASGNGTIFVLKP